MVDWFCYLPLSFAFPFFVIHSLALFSVLVFLLIGCVFMITPASCYSFFSSVHSLDFFVLHQTVCVLCQCFSCDLRLLFFFLSSFLDCVCFWISCPAGIQRFCFLEILLKVLLCPLLYCVVLLGGHPVSRVIRRAGERFTKHCIGNFVFYNGNNHQGHFQWIAALHSWQ